MAAGDLVQKGAVVEVGFAGITNTTYGILQSISGPKRGADVREIRGLQNATVTKLYTNPHRTCVVEVVVTNTTRTEIGLLEALKPGDTVALNTGGTAASRSSENWCVDQAGVDVKLGSLETVATLNLIKEDSMSYT